MIKFINSVVFSCILGFTGMLNAQEIANGQVLSRDLLTNDAKKAAEFYSALFGWKMVQKEKFISLEKEGQLMADVIEVDSKKQPIWVPLFAYDKLDKAKEIILKNGGTVLRDVKQTEGIGDYLLLRDQENALFVLTNVDDNYVKPKFPQVNEWLWDEIWSFDVEGSQAFYTQLFDYEVEKFPSGYVLFTHKKEWLSGLLQNPFESSRTQWGSTIRVNDPIKTSEEAVRLGGKILVSGEALKGPKNEAILADPTGAVFIVQKYEEQEQK